MRDRCNCLARWGFRTLSLLLAAQLLFAAGCGHKKESQEQEAKEEQAVLSSYDQNNVFVQTVRKLKKDPKNPSLLYHLADLYDRNGQYPKAVENYTKVIEVDPDMGYAYFKMGTAYSRMKQPEKAIKYLRIATKKLPRNPVARNNLGIAYGQVGRLDDEIAAFKEAIAIRPRYSAARFNLAVTYLKKGDRKQAQLQYQALLKFDVTMAGEVLKRMDSK